MKQLQKSLDGFISQLTEDGKKLKKNVEEELSRKLTSILNEFLFVLKYCETPIEELFAINFVPLLQRSRINRIYQITDFDAQTTIYIDEDTSYRVDFSLLLVDPVKREMKFVIECDGHDFHEKTKEQVRKDKERERAIQKEGYILIRFSGSEIHQDPLKCAMETIEIIEGYVKKYAF